ncbi:MAG TPA: TRAP transporter large permease [Gammaproteobacteria bacterium]
MSGLLLTLTAFAVLLGLIFVRMPIGLAMLLIGSIGIWFTTGNVNVILASMKSLTYDTFSSYSLSVVPLFLLMGQFATHGGMSEALFKAAAAWVGHRRGGIAMATIAACAGFGAICGSSLATAATMGGVALPEMRKHGYSGQLTTGCLAAGGTLGILIPPSVVLVIYAILTEQNIIKLFVAALIPGILAALGYIVTIAVLVRLTPDAATASARATRAQRLRALVNVWPVLAIFVTVIGGIYVGWFTPTEGAAVGAVGTALVAWRSGRLGWNGLLYCILGTASATAMIFFIIFGATVFNTFLAFSQIPQQAAEFILASGIAPMLVLLAMLVTYLVLGCVMDSVSMILLTVPIFFPIIAGLDFGLSPEDTALWFGIIVLIVVEVGLITPPVGMNIFIINSLAPDIPLGTTYRGVLPFLVSDGVRVALLVAFPPLTLWLVHLMY